MGHHHYSHQIHYQHTHHHVGDNPYDDPFLKGYCYCQCLLAISYIFRGFRRCIFLVCDPVFKCFGWYESGYHHIQHNG